MTVSWTVSNTGGVYCRSGGAMAERESSCPVWPSSATTKIGRRLPMVRPGISEVMYRFPRPSSIESLNAVV